MSSSLPPPEEEPATASASSAESRNLVRVPILPNHQHQECGGRRYDAMEQLLRPPRDFGARVPILVSDDIIVGSLSDSGRMSAVRRFFCLLVTFDVLFCGLLWVITVIVTGRDIVVALHQQVLEYTIYSSMFDCVMCAALRFSVCIICYAVLDIHHWWPIALTTSGTSAFLVAKVFKYQWDHVDSLTFDVSLVLLSFVLAWGELWFLDFRVLPIEGKAREFWNHGRSRGFVGGGGERTPLLPPPARSTMLERYMESAETVSITGSNFYSLAHSLDHSDEENQSLEGDATDWRNFGRRTNAYKGMANELVQTAWRITTKSPDWKPEGESKSTGDKVDSRLVDGRKTLRLSTTLGIPARILLEEMFYKVESAPAWNNLITEVRTVRSLDSNTDLIYQVCAPGGGGVVSTRDFVYLRHWELIDGAYVMANVSVNHPSVPPRHDRVRGESGPCCFVIRQSETQPNECHVRWLLDTDLKISLPKFVLDKAVVSSMFDYVNILRKRIVVLKSELAIEDCRAKR